MSPGADLPIGLHRPILDLVDPRAAGGGPDRFFFEWHHRLIVTGAGPFQFFTGTEGAAPWVTNWQFGTSRFSAGNAFQLWGCGIEFALRSATYDGLNPADSINLDEAYDLMFNLVLHLRIENKDYQFIPISMVPWGAGLYRVPLALDAPAGALPAQAHLELGFPAARCQFTLQPGVWIGPEYQFVFEMLSRGTIAGNHHVRGVMSGIWERNVQ